ncbi:MAG TPA: hypothetical protein VEZ16_00305 [Microvirga sp.]|nr:hypothetical protein [Microvirga sp.]
MSLAEVLAEAHLSADEVLEILEIIQEFDPIVVGGQSINLWVDFFAESEPELSQWGPYTSKDIDFFRNKEAATHLASALNGKMRVPTSMDDASPNAATVVGTLGNKRIEVDFLGRVLGVDESSIAENCVTIEGVDRVTGERIRILVMHPLDCLRSRLSNLNDLKRRDEIALNQARASIVVLRAFVADLLTQGLWRQAQTILHALYFVIRDGHCGKASHLQLGLQPEIILRQFIDHPGLDERWRALILQKSIDRIEAKLANTAIRLIHREK